MIVNFAKNKLVIVFLCVAGCVCLPAGANDTQATESLIPSATAKLTVKELEWIGDKVYQNECASKPENLIYWGSGEEFPSLGIGHFIWYPQDVEGRFQETFPELVAYLSDYEAPPAWLSDLKPFKAPWKSKQELERHRQSSDLTLLQDWLLHTRKQQTQFIVLQLEQRMSAYFTAHASKKERDLQPEILALYKRLLNFKEGRFALIDYVNFKGIGAKSEAYQGETWGLVSVLLEVIKNEAAIDSDTALLHAFVDAAKQRLALRVSLAPKERGEQRWLKGWFKRLDGYLE